MVFIWTSLGASPTVSKTKESVARDSEVITGTGNMIGSDPSPTGSAGCIPFNSWSSKASSAAFEIPTAS